MSRGSFARVHRNGLLYLRTVDYDQSYSTARKYNKQYQRTLGNGISLDFYARYHLGGRGQSFLKDVGQWGSGEDTHTDTHRIHADACNDNTQRPNMASGKKKNPTYMDPYQYNTIIVHYAVELLLYLSNIQEHSEY